MTGSRSTLPCNVEIDESIDVPTEHLAPVKKNCYKKDSDSDKEEFLNSDSVDQGRHLTVKQLLANQAQTDLEHSQPIVKSSERPIMTFAKIGLQRTPKADVWALYHAESLSSDLHIPSCDGKDKEPTFKESITIVVVATRKNAIRHLISSSWYISRTAFTYCWSPRVWFDKETLSAARAALKAEFLKAVVSLAAVFWAFVIMNGWVFFIVTLPSQVPLRLLAPSTVRFSGFRWCFFITCTYYLARIYQVTFCRTFHIAFVR